MHSKVVWLIVALFSMTTGIPSVYADAGHGDKKPAAGMEGVDPGKHGPMDHSKMSDSKHDHWMAPPEMAKRKNPIPADKASRARSVVKGKQIYDANCASCHGQKGKGDGSAGKALNPQPPNLAMMAPQHSPGDLAWKIETGRGPMPAWKGVLTENEIWDVVNYIRSLGGKQKSGTQAPGGRAH